MHHGGKAHTVDCRLAEYIEQLQKGSKFNSGDSDLKLMRELAADPKLVGFRGRRPVGAAIGLKRASGPVTYVGLAPSFRVQES